MVGVYVIGDGSGGLMRGLVVVVLSAVVALSGQAGAGETSSGTPASISVASSTSTSFTSEDFGFADGSTIFGGGLAQRLDGMAGYVPGKAPIVRVDLDWAYVERCRGCPLAWDRLDPLVDGAAARGMRVLLILGYAPAWANGGHASDKWFPTSDADWVSIVDRTVRHFGSRVQAYEVWNEPNIPAFGNYATDPKVRYWQLVRLAHQRVHAACGACVVLAGASASNLSGNESAVWLDWAYRNGYRSYFDAVTHHPYPAWNSGYGPARPECTYRSWNMFGPPDEDPACGELAYVHSVMVAHGDAAKKIWATEFGYPTSGAAGTPLATVRDYLVQGVQMWRSLSYTGPLFLYSYRDACPDPDDPECNFGLVTADFTRKEPLFTDLAAALRYTYPQCLGSPPPAPGEEWPPSLRSGQCMQRLTALTSPDGRFQLWLQDDGNLVLYRRADGVALWATGTRDGARLHNQADGNLVLYRADGRAIWSTGTYTQGPSTLWLQHDGNLVLYRDSDGLPTWASGTVGW